LIFVVFGFMSWHRAAFVQTRATTMMKSVLSALQVATQAASVPIEQTHSVMETLPAKKFMIQVRVMRVFIYERVACCASRLGIRRRLWLLGL
jgi:hypothetical protein